MAVIHETKKRQTTSEQMKENTKTSLNNNGQLMSLSVLVVYSYCPINSNLLLYRSYIFPKGENFV